MHAANHAGCAPGRDEVLPKHKHQPIAYWKTITAEDMLAVLPSKLPFCAYSICVDEVAVEGDIVPSLVGGPSPVLYGFCMEHAGVPEIQSGSEWVALRWQPEAGTIHLASVRAVWLIVPMHREVSNRDTSRIAFSAINHFCVFFRFKSRQRSTRGPESEVAHKWAWWLHKPCRLGDPHRFRAGGRIRSGPQVGKVPT